MNNKGNILDFFYIIVILFIIGVVFVVSYLIVDTSDATGVFDDTPEAASAIANSKGTLLSLDNLMLFVLIGMSIAVLVSSFLVYNHPAFFFVSFFLLLIAIVVAAIASNTIWTLFDAENISAAANNFPKLQFLFNHLPYYIGFMGLATLVAMFTSYRVNQ